MTVLNTRLKESDREQSINSLHTILDRVVQTIQMPVQDGCLWANLRNSKVPKELTDAMDVCMSYGYKPDINTVGSLRFIVEHEGKHYSSKVLLPAMAIDRLSFRQPFQYSTEHMNIQPGLFKTGRYSGNCVEGMMASTADLHEHLGEENTELFLEWIVATSLLRNELKEAREAVTEIFEMAKTAGQIKRMVPDLLQYLPSNLQRAYQNQVRASSLPFEWAPYPKDKVERMMITIGKGHLMAGLAKETQMNWKISNLDSVVWGVQVQIEHDQIDMLPALKDGDSLYRRSMSRTEKDI